MIISEEKFAAAIVTAGTMARFDDTGCMVEYMRVQPAAPEEVWVHDHASGGWIAAEPAWFVRDPKGATPMGSGLVAFASRTEAEAFAAEGDALVETWEQVTAPQPAE